MKKNKGEYKEDKYKKTKMRSTKGITLVALVVTIIVLLILAGVSLSAVFSQQGIFNRAENAVDKHSQSKARETLDLTFSEAQMKKYDEGLSEEELDKKIEEVGQLLPKDDPESKNQLVIVDGYIFEIDRSVPKVVEYKGPADGIIITATISGNNGWVKPGESVTVKGSIKIYGEGSIASSNAEVTKGSTTITGFPSKGGDYTISNITEDTDIKITATDSTGKTYEKTIQVVIKRDTTPPTITELKVETERMKIEISVTAHDKNISGIEESGIAQINYEITPVNGIKDNNATGTLKSGEPITVEASKEGTFTIKVTATDKVGQTSTKTETIEVINGITIAQAREKINASNLKDYIGTKIIDYIPDNSGVAWRVFYQDNENQGNGKGYFGDDVGTIYLKRDYDSLNNSTTLTQYTSHTPSDGGSLMKQMNPLWRDSSYSTIDLENEHWVSWLCDPEDWKQYKTSEAKYAIGSPSVEMYMKAYNVLKEDNTALVCKVESANGYSVGANGTYISNGESLNDGTLEWEILGNLEQSTSAMFWLSSPSIEGIDSVIMENTAQKRIHGSWRGTGCKCEPVVALFIK